MVDRTIQIPRTVAISTSDSPDVDALGLSEGHHREAVADLAMYLLASGASLAYGGDLRNPGFAELLFEMVMSYRQVGDTSTRVSDYLAWPVHISMAAGDLNEHSGDLPESVQLVLIDLDGRRMPMEARTALPSRVPTARQWSEGLTSMRQTMHGETDARVVMGGRVEGFRGRMPGIAEETLLSLQSGQPVYLLGGFGGCTRDIAETIGLVDAWAGSRSAWPSRRLFELYGPDDLNNGLSAEENRVLACTPHIDQAVTLVMRGLHRLRSGGHFESGRAGD